MAASGLLFLAGAMPSILPFLIIDSVTTAVLAATILAMAGLFMVGVVKANVARTGRLRSGLENLVIAGVGGVVAYGIGRLFGTPAA
jgi:VIT1/CCC1 family predicted Fe2+/Mn2+ transporter